jgi:hypothetical protein
VWAHSRTPTRQSRPTDQPLQGSTLAYGVESPCRCWAVPQLWDRRALSEAQLRLAADDVAYLHALKTALMNRINTRGPELADRVGGLGGDGHGRTVYGGNRVLGKSLRGSS